MKLKFLPATLLCAVVGIGLPAGYGYAQDKGLSPNNKGLSPDEAAVEVNHTDANATDEKTSPADHDAKPKVVARDSMMSHKAVPIPSPVVKQKPAERKTQTPEDEDDALSFNFLYYVIQKFKISDLIDE